jgi:hypothetical protein
MLSHVARRLPDASTSSRQPGACRLMRMYEPVRPLVVGVEVGGHRSLFYMPTTMVQNAICSSCSCCCTFEMKRARTGEQRATLSALPSPEPAP